MRLPMLRNAAIPLVLLAAAACTDNAEPATERGEAADADAAAAGGAAAGALDTSPAAVADARARAVEMVGGADALRGPGNPRILAAGEGVTPAMQQAARAAVAPGGQDCASLVDFSTAWAARLPASFPVYPRAATQEAAGTDEGDCSLRIVTFRTPVPLGEVLAFYNTRAASDGFSAEYVRVGEDDILSGTREGAAYVIYGREIDGGLTEVDLVTSAG